MNWLYLSRLVFLEGKPCTQGLPLPGQPFFHGALVTGVAAQMERERLRPPCLRMLALSPFLSLSPFLPWL